MPCREFYAIQVNISLAIFYAFFTGTALLGFLAAGKGNVKIVFRMSKICQPRSLKTPQYKPCCFLLVFLTFRCS